MEEIEQLLRRSAFRSIRADVRYWRDESAYVRALEKYHSHPPVAEILDSWTGSVRQDKEWLWRVWVKRPRWIRLEESIDGGRSWLTSGGDGDRSWNLGREGKASVWKDQSIAMLTTEGAASGYDPQAYELSDRQDIVHTHAHPLVAELVDPSELLWVGLAFEWGPDREHLGRRAATARAWIGDWDRWSPDATENVTVADDYELSIDAATGVILRFAWRLEDREYGATEMTEVAFDEDLAEELFRPPRR